MWLVADSGSTKTEWVLFDSKGVIEQIISPGLNPLFLSEEEFISEVTNSIPAEKRLAVTKLWFYGAGCGSEIIKNKAQNWLQQSFDQAIIEVDSDLLAAARATCGSSEGLVAILGTGSNSCFYDGVQIKDHIKPLGFILGDEGSGAALGKALLKKLLRNQLSADLSNSIYKEIGLDYEAIIGNIYHGKWPNRFLASTVRVLYSHKSAKEVLAIIEEEFERFASILKMYNKSLSINLIGSVAFYFEDELRNSLQKVGLSSGLIIKSPAKSLVSYHQENG